jgi:tRNA-dihydrouridine synthase
MVCRDKGEDRGVREMRKQIAWYLKGLEGAANLRRQVVKAHSLGQVQRILEDSQPPAQE